jgi:hypothetical protein
MDRVFRCSDGHYFTANWGRLALGSMHFGESKFLRCPVDHHWRMAKAVPAANLTAEEAAQAKQYSF